MPPCFILRNKVIRQRYVTIQFWLLQTEPRRDYCTSMVRVRSGPYCHGASTNHFFRFVPSPLESSLESLIGNPPPPSSPDPAPLFSLLAVFCSQKPELLSRFIPPDPLIGRVSLSSPQRPIAALGPVVSIGTVGSSSSSPVTAALVSTGGMGGSSERGGARFRQGAVGLENDGNSCYLNATLQVLARCTPLRTHLVECVGRRNSTNIAGRPW